MNRDAGFSMTVERKEMAGAQKLDDDPLRRSYVSNKVFQEFTS